MATNELDASEVRAWMLPEQIEASNARWTKLCEGQKKEKKKHEEMENFAGVF